jgi:hypothetical protein
MARSEVTYIYDAANAFRAPGSAALVASGQINELALDKLVKVRPGSRRNQLGSETYDVVIVVNSLAATGTYVFDVKTGAGETKVKVGEVAVNKAGQFVLKLDAATIEKLDANRETITLSLTVGGTTPSIKFSAWLA